MKTVTITKNLFHMITRASAFLYFIYFIAMALIHAANLAPFTIDNIVALAIPGLVLGLMCIIDYTLKIVHRTLKRQRRLYRTRLA